MYQLTMLIVKGVHKGLEVQKAIEFAEDEWEKR